MRRTAQFAGLLLATMSAAWGQSPQFEVFSGAWKGTGWVREEINGPRIPSLCRLSIDTSSSGRDLKMTGKCVVKGRTVRISNRLRETQAGQYRGRWWTSAGIATDDMRGSYNGNDIVLAWLAVDKNTKTTERYAARWRFSPTQIVISIVIVSRDNTEMTKLVLKR